jgi:CBS domain-containing protein
VATDRVFVARLVGLPVYGPDGERIGRMRDLVAGVRVDANPPRVLGMVVEMMTRRRIFVPMLRITTIDPGAVTLATGLVSLRRFVQRPNEVLVVGQLIDAPVRLTDTGVDAVVVDAAVEPTRARDWVVSRLAVRERRGRLGRRGQTQIVAWGAVSGLTLTDRQGTAGLLAVLETLRPADVAATLSELPEKRRHEVVDALDDERLADVFEEMSESDQRALVAYVGADRAADLMEPDESAPVRRLLHYADDTAGGLMTPEPIVLRPDATVAEALALIRNPDIPPALASMVFVCRPPSSTPTGRYLGCVHAQRLLREAPFELVAGLVDTDLATLPPDATMGELTRYFAAYNLVAGPVVDTSDHLLGAVTVDDLLDHMLPVDWRDRLSDNGQETADA